MNIRQNVTFFLVRRRQYPRYQSDIFFLHCKLHFDEKNIEMKIVTFVNKKKIFVRIVRAISLANLWFLPVEI